MISLSAPALAIGLTVSMAIVTASDAVQPLAVLVTVRVYVPVALAVG